MCWFCDDIKKFINKSVVVYDDATANASKEYSYLESTVTLKITAGGYRGNSHILTGMRELNDLKYCPNCGEKIEDFDNCASKENDRISCEIEGLKRDIEDLKKNLDDISIGVKDQLDNCSFNLYDVNINLAELRRIEKKMSEIENSKIFKYIKED